ncbi:MAG: hypothetical protein V1733_11645 [bacterium]
MIISAGITLAEVAYPQDPPPLPGGHGQNGNPPVGAPIDGGLGILLALGATYAGRKIYVARKKKRQSASS